MDKILSTLADNPALTEAVRKAIEKHFSLENMETSLPNAELGELVRAKVEGMKMIDLAFKEIARNKSTPDPVSRVNEAR